MLAAEVDEEREGVVCSSHFGNGGTLQSYGQLGRDGSRHAKIFACQMSRFDIFYPFMQTTHCAWQLPRSHAGQSPCPDSRCLHTLADFYLSPPIILSSSSALSLSFLHLFSDEYTFFPADCRRAQ